MISRRVEKRLKSWASDGGDDGDKWKLAVVERQRSALLGLDRGEGGDGMDVALTLSQSVGLDVASDPRVFHVLCMSLKRYNRCLHRLPLADQFCVVRDVLRTHGIEMPLAAYSDAPDAGRAVMDPVAVGIIRRMRRIEQGWRRDGTMDEAAARKALAGILGTSMLASAPPSLTSSAAVREAAGLRVLGAAEITAPPPMEFHMSLGAAVQDAWNSCDRWTHAAAKTREALEWTARMIAARGLPPAAADAILCGVFEDL